MIQHSSYYRPQLSQHAHAQPTLAQALMTTGPLSSMPAQVALGLYVAQSTPWPRVLASTWEKAGWKVAIWNYFVILVYGQRRQAVVTQYGCMKSPNENSFMWELSRLCLCPDMVKLSPHMRKFNVIELTKFSKFYVTLPLVASKAAVLQSQDNN